MFDHIGSITAPVLLSCCGALQELAASAKEQQQKLQQQVALMLQTQQLIATTEQTVTQLRSNMAAFENNPQAQATAAAALQQAQSHLEPAKQLVSKLQAALDMQGVQWDPSSGQVTHINHQPLLQQGAADKARGSRSAAAAGSLPATQQPSREAGKGPVGMQEQMPPADKSAQSQPAAEPIDTAAAVCPDAGTAAPTGCLRSPFTCTTGLATLRSQAEQPTAA